jgi:predicted sugar kinase
MRSAEDLAAMLVFMPEQERWSLLRDILLSLRSEVAEDMGENPYARAIEYLYTLVRFVETAKRYPSKTEQGDLFEELNSPTSEKSRSSIPPMVTLLRKASQSPKSRKAIRQLKEKQRSYRDEGQEFPDSPYSEEGDL